MKKRILMFLTVAGLMVGLSAAAALAVSTAAVIEGDDRDETLLETPQDDQMFGRGGEDRLDAQRYGGDIDELFGNQGRDDLQADDGDGNDVLRGGRGADECDGDPGDTFRSCAEIET
jgi:hypothetical protein